MNEHKDTNSAARSRHWSVLSVTVAGAVVVATGFAWSGTVRARSGSSKPGALGSVLAADAAAETTGNTDGRRDGSALEQLGQRVFEDPELSTPPGRSCSSCHEPGHAFSGNGGSTIGAVAVGSRQRVFGTRNVPSIAYAMFRPPFAVGRSADGDRTGGDAAVGGLFWDGRADTFAEQARGPLLNPREMNNADVASVVDKIRRASYAQAFRDEFGKTALDDAESAFEHVGEALAAFQMTPPFHRFSSKFDDYLRGRADLDIEETRGFELFRDPNKGNCIACHAGKLESRAPSDWPFSNFGFEVLGLPRNRKLPDNVDPAYFDLGLCQRPDLAGKVPARFDAKKVCGAFQVPSLRNVALTAPYGHNGVFETLREVVSFYATRDTNPDRWYPTIASHVQRFDDLPPEARTNVNHDEVPYDRKPGEAPRLNDVEIDAILAFLRTLTDR